ncbi:MAG: InlB B-repeat-containing protein [Bifidobacterium sp.]|nr:InlB B-repeat-containing protein [Bifidobacterium sp.]
MDTGGTASDPGAPTTVPRDSHGESAKFLGWYDGDVKYDFTKPVTGDLTLKAKWGDARHKITFDSMNGGSSTDSWVVDGALLTPPSEPSRTGYRFDAWYLIRPSSLLLEATRGADAFDFTTTIPRSDFTLYGGWVKTWDVTFDENGGSVHPATQTRDEGLKATNPDVPGTPPFDHHSERSVFKGWVVVSTGEPYDFDTPLTGDVALKAKWADAHHNVTFDSQDGSPVPGQSVADGYKLTEPQNPTKTGYRFDAWYTDATGGSKLDFNVAPDHDFTTYAQWIKTWNVTFDPAGGIGQPAMQVVNQGDKATRPAAGAVSRDGYVLAGWLDSQGRDYGFDTGVTADVALTAKWAPDKTALNALIEQAKGDKQSDYTPDTWKPLQDALDHAESVSKDQDASKSDVDQAMGALQDALNGLKLIGSNGANGSDGLAGLNGLIGQAAEAEAGRHRQSDYTQDSWKAFQDALNHDKAVARDPNASQSDIDQAAAALRAALAGLKLRNGLTNTGAAVTAPATLALTLTALAGLALALRKRKENE